MAITTNVLRTREGVLRYPNQAAAILNRLLNVWNPSQIASCRVLLDASDLSTLFQNNTGTTPVTTSGQDVGRWVSKATGSVQFNLTSIAPPSYDISEGSASVRWNGTRRALIQSALNLSATASVTTVTALTKLSNAAIGRVASFGSANPLFGVSSPSSAAANNVAANVNGGTAREVVVTEFDALETIVVTTRHFINNQTPSVQIRVNGGAWTNQASSAGASANFGTAIYAIGGDTAGTGLLLNALVHNHSLFIESLSDANLALVETWAAAKAGIAI